MTRDQLLQRLGLTDSQLNDLLAKFRNFYGSLNAAQQNVVNRAVPHFPQIAWLLGGDITPDQLKSFLAPPPAPAPSGGVKARMEAAATPADDSSQNGINQITNTP